MSKLENKVEGNNQPNLRYKDNPAVTLYADEMLALDGAALAYFISKSTAGRTFQTAMDEDLYGADHNRDSHAFITEERDPLMKELGIGPYRGRGVAG